MAGTGRTGGGIANLSGGSFLPSLANGGWMDSLKNFGSTIGDSFGSFGEMLGGEAGQGWMKALPAFANIIGMNRALGQGDEQLALMNKQEGRATTAQNLSTGHNLSLALQMTTPGTPEHQRIKDAIAQNTYGV